MHKKKTQIIFSLTLAINKETSTLKKKSPCTQKFSPLTQKKAPVQQSATPVYYFATPFTNQKTAMLKPLTVGLYNEAPAAG